MNVIEHSNWTNKKIEYIKNVNITEYDLQDGGLSVIKEYKLLNDKYINQLVTMEKEKRNIVIGKLQAKLRNLSSNMVLGFGKARQLFVDTNNILDDDILSIKKDAMFIINRHHIITKISENLNFRIKNAYSSYINLNRKEFFWSSILRELIVKGLSDEVKELQKDFLLKNIGQFLNQSEKIQKEQLYENLKKYRSDYLNRKLPIETYRNLDTGLYTIDDFEINTADNEYIEMVDISYNFINYINPLIQRLMRYNNKYEK